MDLLPGRSLADPTAVGSERRRSSDPLEETPFSSLGLATGGAWTSADAAAAGVPHSLIRLLLRNGEWQRLHHAVYARGGIEPDSRMRAWAAVLATGPPALPDRPMRPVATGRTAAAVLGVPLIGCAEGEDVSVLARRQVRTRPAIRVIHRSRPSPITFEEGLPLAAGHEIALPTEGRGTRRLQAADGLADGRAESPLETVGRLAARAVLPDLEPQLAGGRPGASGNGRERAERTGGRRARRRAGPHAGTSPRTPKIQPLSA